MKRLFINLSFYFEPIGLALLLIAFGWQCMEEHSSHMRYEGYIYELDQKIEAIWSGIKDEAMHSDRYKGEEMIYVNYDSIDKGLKDWEQIKEKFKTINKQYAICFWLRVGLYVVGSLLIILSKWPNKTD